MTQSFFQPFLRPLAAASVLLATATAGAGDPPPQYRLEVVASYPHDAGAFTQGLVWAGGGFFESVGRYGKSALRRVDLKTGAVRAQRRLADHYFAEGLAQIDGRLIQLTWKAGRGFIYDADSLAPTGRFEYPGEGWGLAYDGERLIMSDGSEQLRFLDPETLRETGRLTVTLAGRPLPRLNELEIVRGEIWANVWPTDAIARIDPDTGTVTGIVQGRSLRDLLPDSAKPDVLNGIAYDKDGDRIFITGKWWPRLFEVHLVPVADAP